MRQRKLLRVGGSNYQAKNALLAAGFFNDHPDAETITSCDCPKLLRPPIRGAIHSHGEIKEAAISGTPNSAIRDPRPVARWSTMHLNPSLEVARLRKTR